MTTGLGEPSKTGWAKLVPELLPQAALSAEDLQGAGTTLRRLERFWIRAGDFVQRPPQFAA